MGIDILIIGLIYKYPHWGHWIIFAALLLAGCHLPISEDLMILTSGVLASVFVPENKYKLWACLFVGAYLSDWIAYWTGRLLGNKILKIKWLSKIVKKERLDKMHAFYEKWGFFAFLVGRFVPFGVRNCLYISAGMGKMSFNKFLLVDGFASLISTTTGFFVAYSFGKHYQVLLDYIKTFDFMIFAGIALVVVAIIGFFWYKKVKKKRKKQCSEIAIDSTPSL